LAMIQEPDTARQYKAACNACRRYARAQARESRADLPGQIQDSSPGPHDEVDREDLLERLWLAADLTEGQATVIELTYWDRWSDTDIAFHLAVRPGTVFNLRIQAIRKIRKILVGMSGTDPFTWHI